MEKRLDLLNKFPDGAFLLISDRILDFDEQQNVIGEKVNNMNWTGMFTTYVLA